MFLQADRSPFALEKYLQYGCYCFPQRDAQLFVGRGDPVDEVDKVCKAFQTCYRYIMNFLNNFFAVSNLNHTSHLILRAFDMFQNVNECQNVHKCPKKNLGAIGPGPNFCDGYTLKFQKYQPMSQNA